MNLGSLRRSKVAAYTEDFHCFVPTRTLSASAGNSSALKYASGAVLIASILIPLFAESFGGWPW